MGILWVPRRHSWRLRPSVCGAASLIERRPSLRDNIVASSLRVKIVIKNEEHIDSFAFLHIYGLFNDDVSSSYCVP